MPTTLGTFVSTSYGPPWGGIQGQGVTAGGVDLKDGKQVYGVAVDPKVIPLGSTLQITPNPFNYNGEFLAFDTGGAIKGKRIDFYDWRGRTEQKGWGRKSVKVTLVQRGSGAVSNDIKLWIPDPLGILPDDRFDTPIPDLGIPGIKDAIGFVANAAQQIAQGLALWVKFAIEAWKTVLSLDTWIKVGKIIFGTILLYMGLKRLFYIAS